MDRLSHIQAQLGKLKLSEGEHFLYDENAILEKYKAKENNKSSLSIKMLSIFGGFLATVAFIGFLFIAGLHESETGLIIFGIGAIAFAIWINKNYDKVILDTLGISTFVSGLFLFAMGLNGMDLDHNAIVLSIIIMASISLFLVQKYIMSFTSILAITGSLVSLVINNELFNFIHLYIAVITIAITYLFLNESKLLASRTTISKLYDPARMGLIVSLLFGLFSIGIRDLIPISQNLIWISSVVIIAAIFYMVSRILKVTGVETTKTKTYTYVLTALVLAPTVFSPAISGALLIILLCFFVHYKSGLVVGIISLIYFISQYYYDLHFTLLVKAIILFSSGILFLLFYLFTSKKYRSHDKI